MLDAVIVGAGFAGLYVLHRLRGLGLTARVYEAGDGVGGTWYWNRYPGARCDVESMDYSYSFSDELQQEWRWTERYASQPEILTYINHVADRFDLRRDIQLETRVTSAVFDETDEPVDHRDRPWRPCHGALLHHGHRLPVGARRCPPSRVSRPSRAGGITPAHWPHEGVDFTGQRVGDHRHRLLRDPVHPDHRRAGRASPRLPAHAELQRAGAQRAARSGVRAAGEGPLRRLPAPGARVAHRLRRSSAAVIRARRCRPRSGSASTRARWSRGGLGLLGHLRRPPHEPGSERDRGRLLPREDPRPSSATPRSPRRWCPKTIRSAPSASASTPTTTPRSTGTT